MLAETSPLSNEWSTLQNNYEQHERGCLQIKLGSVLLLVLCMGFGLPMLAVALVLVLWVQEGILRTVQSRLGDRLLRVEQLLRDQSTQPATPCQLHTEWLAARPGAGGLLKEYAQSMLRPTVAFPYVVLVLLPVGGFVVG